MKEDSFLDDELTEPLRLDPATVEKGLKAGWKTTEFWATIAIVILAFIVSIGVITNDQASAIMQVVGSVLALIAGAAPVAIYSKVRETLKK